MKQRYKHLDAIRCFCVLWVLIVHISLNYGLLKFGVCQENASIFTVLSFYMTPFYVILGYFFSAKKDLNDFAVNRAKRLLIPYITFSIFGLLIFEFFSFVDKGKLVLPSIKSFVPTATLPSNSPCWFFISLFCVNVLFYFIAKRNRLQKLLIICLCLALAFVTSGKMQFLGYGNILLGLVYFYIGTLFKEFEFFIRKKWLVWMSVCICVLISVFDPQRLSFVMNIQVCGMYVLNLLFSITATIVCWNIALLLFFYYVLNWAMRKFFPCLLGLNYDRIK